MWQLIQRTCGLTLSNETVLPTQYNVRFTLLPQCRHTLFLSTKPKYCKIIYQDIGDTHSTSLNRWIYPSNIRKTQKPWRIYPSIAPQCIWSVCYRFPLIGCNVYVIIILWHSFVKTVKKYILVYCKTNWITKLTSLSRLQNDCLEPFKSL